MNLEQIKTWLGLLGEHQVEVSGKWANSHCPLAAWRHQDGSDRKPSFGVSIEPGESKVWCFSCSFGGRQTRLLLELSRLLKGEVHTLNLRGAMELIVAVEEGDEDRVLDLEDDEKVEDFVFSEEWLSRFPPAYAEGGVHWYLEERRMPFEVARFLDLRYMHSEDRVCFPIRNWDGDLVGLHGRAVVDEADLRYRVIKYRDKKNHLAWLGEGWVDVDRPVVFTESVFDLARVYQVYRNVMCPLTASMSVRKISRASPCNSIVTLFDPDQAGRTAARRLRSVLGKHCDVIEVRLGDRDPGDMTVYEVAKILDAEVDLDPLLL